MYIPRYLKGSSLRAAFNAAFFSQCTTHIPERVAARIRVLSDILQSAESVCHPHERRGYNIETELWHPLLMLWVAQPWAMLHVLERLIIVFRTFPNKDRVFVTDEVWKKVLSDIKQRHTSKSFIGYVASSVLMQESFSWYSTLWNYSGSLSWHKSIIGTEAMKKAFREEWNYLSTMYRYGGNVREFNRWLSTSRFDSLFHHTRKGLFPVREFHAAIANRPYSCAIITK